MKKMVVSGIILAGFLASSVYANDGEKIFNKKGCKACHHPTKDQLSMGMGPSLQMVAKAYKGKEADLVAFFKGSDKPIVAPDKYPTMKGQLTRFKGMSDTDLQSLATFISGH
jgi:cytochrome c